FNMYSLDINFLNDRAATIAPAAGVVRAPKRKITPGELIPLAAGIVFAVIFAGAAGLGWFYLRLQIADYEKKAQILEGEINALQQQNQKIQQLQTQIQVAQRQRDGLATVFVKILPWSAVLADIRDRIPPGGQLESIVENEPKTDAAPSGQDTGVKTMPSLSISGYADSYDTVNYFLLALGRSLFFNTDTGKITSAKLVDDPDDLEAIAEGEGESLEIKLPQVVQYTLEIELNDLSQQPPAELVTHLQRKGAVGSVVRIESLQQKGLIAP
ncbi:MAG: PilN domain-containing protein, partial [Spirulina sp.]